MTQTVAESVIEAILQASADRNQLDLDSRRVNLVTVLSTWGSSPRPPGSMMMWSQATGCVGSVSGGCVEEDLLERFAAGYFAVGSTHLQVYGDEKEGKKFSLPCGGQLLLLVETFEVGNEHAKWQSVLRSLKARTGLARSVELDTGAWSVAESGPFALKRDPSTAHIYVGPSHKLLIVGANQVAFYLAEFSRSLDYAVTICDPGEAKGTQNLDPGVEWIRNYPDGLVEKTFSDAQSAVVAVSHDPRLDDMALLEALPGEAFYIGAMGSARTSKARRQRLQSLGISPLQLQKLRAPIGLDIGSKSPAEIAISIAADLVRAAKKQKV